MGTRAAALMFLIALPGCLHDPEAEYRESIRQADYNNYIRSLPCERCSVRFKGCRARSRKAIEHSRDSALVSSSLYAYSTQSDRPFRGMTSTHSTGSRSPAPVRRDWW